MPKETKKSQVRKNEITHSLACKYFDLNVVDHQALEDLKKDISEKISWLLNNDFESLLNIFYRIDIEEKSFRSVLDNSEHSNISVEMAQLVIERFIQKTEFRMKYSENT